MTTIRKKLIIVGDAGCGKTSLATAFLENQFPGISEKPPSLLENYVGKVEVEGQQVELVLTPITGHETDEREELRKVFYGTMDIVVICFGINSPNSFKNVKDKWAPEVKKYCPNLPLVLVGNNKDLRTHPQTIENLKNNKQRPVTLKEGQKEAKRIGAASYVECAVKTKEGISVVFDKAARAVLGRPEKDDKKKKSCTVL